MPLLIRVRFIVLQKTLSICKEMVVIVTSTVFSPPSFRIQQSNYYGGEEVLTLKERNAFKIYSIQKLILAVVINLYQNLS